MGRSAPAERKVCPCKIWRALAILATALAVIRPVEGRPNARRHQGRAWPERCPGTRPGFVVFPSSSEALARSHPRSRASSTCDGSATTGLPLKDLHCIARRSPSITSAGVWRLERRLPWRSGRFRPRWAAASVRVALQQPAHAVVSAGASVNTSSTVVAAAGGGAPTAGEATAGAAATIALAESPAGARAAPVEQSVEGKQAAVILTAAGGRPHTSSSRAKISAANKGKKPWNKGGNHSEETRRKIAEGARKNALKRKEATAKSLGLTVEEYDEMKSRRRSRGEGPQEISDETRLKISMRLKERWKDPSYREARKSCIPNRRGIAHSEETKARIAAAVKARWQDPEYREKIVSKTPTEETRAKIGQIIRDQWADPEIRKERMAKMAPKTEEHKKRISESIKSKWADPEFRKRTSDKMRAAAHARIVAMGGVPKPARKRRPRDSAAIEARRLSAMARAQEHNRSKWERMRRKTEVKLEREAKKQEKLDLKAAREAEKVAKMEAERKAQEEEDRMVEGLDELEKVLMRQQIRAKKLERQEREAKASKRAKAAAAAKRRAAMQPESQPVYEDVPDGFEMVEINGRKILRMK